MQFAIFNLQSRSSFRLWLCLALLIAVVVRGTASWLSHGQPVVDVHSFWQWSVVFDAGLDPYRFSHNPANYPPLWIYMSWGCLKLSQWSGLSFDLVMKLLISLFDAATVVPVGLVALAAGATKKQAGNAMLFYAVNAVTVLVASYHAQNDPIVIGLVMWACWLLVCVPCRSAPEIGMLLVGVSLAIKPVGILLVPLLVAHIPGWSRRAVGMLLVLLPSLLFWLPYLAGSPSTVIATYQSYRGVPDFGFIGIYNSWRNLGLGGPGISFDYPMTGWFRPFCLLVLAAVWWRFRKVGLVQQVVVIILTLYLVYGKIAAQYLMWIVPFAAAVRSPQLLRVTVYTAVTLVAFYQRFHPGILSGWPHVSLPMGITIPQWNGIFLFAHVMLYLDWFRWLSSFFRTRISDFGIRISR